MADIIESNEKATWEQHVSNKSNPHAVTAEQTGALSINGGTLTGALNINSTTVQQTSTVSGSSLFFDQKNTADSVWTRIQTIPSAKASGFVNYKDSSNYQILELSQNSKAAPTYTVRENDNSQTWTLIHSGNYTNYLPYRIQLLTTAKNFEAPGTAGNWQNEFIAGLSFRPAYQNSNAPTNYGNVLQIGQTGAGQLFLGWSGTDSYTERIWYRSHRDTATGGWGQWKAIPFYTYSTSDLTAGSSALDTGTIHLVYE